MTEVKNLGQLVQYLATKAGIAADDPNLINILSNAELSKVNVHSDMVKAMDESLLHIDTALDNHPSIKSKYTAEILNGVDNKINTIMADAEFSDEEVAEISAVKNSYKRIELVAAKLKEKHQAALEAQKKELEEAGKSSTDDQVKALKVKEEEYLQQLRDAAKKLKDAAKEKDEALAAKETEFSQFKVGQERKLLLAAIGKTIYDELETDTKLLTINSIIDKELQDKEAEFYLDDQKGFSIRKKDGTAFVGANHTSYTPQRFIDETLAQKKILKVSEPEKSGEGKEGGQRKQAEIDAGDQGHKAKTKLLVELQI